MPTAREETRPPRPGGRPRSIGADRAILDAAARLLSDEGYSRLSVERIAAAAGVGKTTIYRRYRDRQELAAAAAVHIARNGPFDAPADVDVRTALVHVLAHVHRAVGSAPVLAMLGTLLTEQPRAPEHLRRFWEHVFAPHQAATRSIIDAGVARGSVRRDAQSTSISEALVGLYLARQLSGLAVTSEWMESVVEVLWEGIAVRRNETAERRRTAGSQAGTKRGHRD